MIHTSHVTALSLVRRGLFESTDMKNQVQATKTGMSKIIPLYCCERYFISLFMTAVFKIKQIRTKCKKKIIRNGKYKDLLLKRSDVPGTDLVYFHLR